MTANWNSLPIFLRQHQVLNTFALIIRRRECCKWFMLIMMGACFTFYASFSAVDRYNSGAIMRPEKPLRMLQRLMVRQWERQQAIGKACLKISQREAQEADTAQNWTDDVIDSLSWDQLDHLIVDEDNKLIYCFVPKVASTNWKRVLLALNRKRLMSRRGAQAHRAGFGADEELDPIHFKGNESIVRSVFRTLNEYTNRTHVEYILRNYLKFLFVRNPYERLLSAYRNKFESTYSDYFRLRFGRKIVKDFRPNATNESLETGSDVTFQEFLMYIISLNRSSYKKEYNEHWRPIHDLCLPCNIPYDLIGKYESIQEDAQLLLWKANVFDWIKFPKRQDTYSSQPSGQLLSDYYSKVNSSILEKLRSIYNDDLELFNYQVPFDIDSTGSMITPSYTFSSNLPSALEGSEGSEGPPSISNDYYEKNR